jgi:hypothetical protein
MNIIFDPERERRQKRISDLTWLALAAAAGACATAAVLALKRQVEKYAPIWKPVP